MRYLSQLYSGSLALLTDLYQLTMAYGYWKEQVMQKEAAFHLFFRRRPFHGGYALAAGLELAVDFIENFRFDASDLEYLAKLENSVGKPLFEKAFLDYLAQLRITCDIDAIPEGTAVFPYQPLLRVTGPIIQAQLLESPLLNIINFQSLIATKASRICHAAQKDEVWEFGLRRAQGIDGSVAASRASYIGGCAGTSNVLAGKLFGIPVRGTHAHSWVMAFDEEVESFYSYARALPDNCVFLVDTYDTIQGVNRAIEVGRWLKSQGKKLLGIRLDSGDLAYFSIEARKLLNDAGFHDTVIMASNELDEAVISELKRQGAQINVWGVGTKLVTSSGQSALDGVYKLTAIRSPGQPWQYRLKLSEQMMKMSTPGILQVRRFFDKQGKAMADAIYSEEMPVSFPCSIVDPLDITRTKVITGNAAGEDLLVPIIRKGKKVYDLPPIHEIRRRAFQQLNLFHDGIKRFLNPHEYVAGLESTLHETKIRLIKNIRNKDRVEE